MRIIFCTLDRGAGTAWLRAGMISQFINFEGKRESHWTTREELSKSLENLKSDDCVIFVKFGFGEDLVKEVRRRCRFVFLDPSDDRTVLNTSYWTDLVDGVLHDTEHQKNLLSELGYKQIIQIEHMHSNFDSKFNQVRKPITSPIVAGYMGLPNQLDCSQEIIEKITKTGIGWYQASPNIQSNAIHTLCIDCQIVHVDQNERREICLKTKPHNKLMNCLSYGIPSLSSPYDSYVRVLKDNKLLINMIADTVDRKVEKLLTLFTNQKLYVEVSNECFSLSQKYHVSNYRNCYSGLFELLEG